MNDRLYRTKVLSILKALSVNSRNGPPYELDPIRRSVMTFAGIDEISFTDYMPLKQGIDGKFEVYHDLAPPYAMSTKSYARVFYSNQLNCCWRRFVICKEMCQLLWHDVPQMRVSSSVQAMALVASLALHPNQRRLLPQGWSEDASIRAAMDILFPMEDRVQIMEDCAAKGIKPSTFQIAQTYRVPEIYVKVLLIETIHNSLVTFWSEE